MVYSRWFKSEDLENNGLLQMDSEQRFRKKWFALDGFRVKIQKRIVCSRWFQSKDLEKNGLLQMVSE